MIIYYICFKFLDAFSEGVQTYLSICVGELLDIIY